MIQALESILFYEFKDKSLLQEAITHPSASKRNACNDIVNYERLEFLGDAVLGLVVAELLVTTFQTENEGALAKRHAALVTGEAVAKIAAQIGIGEYITMTDGEAAMGGRENVNNIENALEAIIGAIYQDGGLDQAKAFISRHWDTLAKEMKEPPKDPKTGLQEWAQGLGLPIPVYEVIQVDGPSHAPIFTVKLSVEGIEATVAQGETKKKAEKQAAKIMLQKIEATNG